MNIWCIRFGNRIIQPQFSLTIVSHFDPPSFHNTAAKLFDPRNPQFLMSCTNHDLVNYVPTFSSQSTVKWIKPYNVFYCYYMCRNFLWPKNIWTVSTIMIQLKWRYKTNKVEILWEGHKILRNHHLTFGIHYIVKSKVEIL